MPKAIVYSGATFSERSCRLHRAQNIMARKRAEKKMRAFSPTCVALLLLSLLTVVVARAADRPVILAILEDVPAHYAGQSDFRAVRVVFEKRGTEWEPVHADSDIGAGLSWTIAFDGRNLGKVVTRGRKHLGFISDVGLQDIVNPGSVPTVGKRSEMYGGFLESAVYRPPDSKFHAIFRGPGGVERRSIASASCCSSAPGVSREVPEDYKL